MGTLDGRVALVTVGSKGLGGATARLFKEAGAPVVIIFSDDLEAAERLIAGLPATATAPAIPRRRMRGPSEGSRAVTSPEGPTRHPDQQPTPVFYANL